MNTNIIFNNCNGIENISKNIQQKIMINTIICLVQSTKWSEDKNI